MSKVASLLYPALIICKLSPAEGLNHMNKTHRINMPYSGRRTSLGFQSYVVARLLLSNRGVPQYLQK